MDLIKNLEHVHMNGTRWVKLSEFVEVISIYIKMEGNGIRWKIKNYSLG